MEVSNIKFRGKRIDNGEWVCGDLTRYSEAMSYITVDLIEDKVHQVHTSTVGQYTGLKDKRGIEIYEGDTVKAFKYNEIPFGFDITKNHGMLWFGNWHWLEFQNDFRNLEVIGNIHDQKEKAAQ